MRLSATDVARARVRREIRARWRRLSGRWLYGKGWLDGEDSGGVGGLCRMRRKREREMEK